MLGSRIAHFEEFWGKEYLLGWIFLKMECCLIY